MGGTCSQFLFRACTFDIAGTVSNTNTATQVAAALAAAYRADTTYTQVARVGNSVYVQAGTLESGFVTAVQLSNGVVAVVGAIGGSCNSLCHRPPCPCDGGCPEGGCSCPIEFANAFVATARIVVPNVGPAAPIWCPTFYDNCEELPTTVYGALTACGACLGSQQLVALGFNCAADVTEWQDLEDGVQIRRRTAKREDGAVVTVTYIRRTTAGKIQSVLSVAVPNMAWVAPGSTSFTAATDVWHAVSRVSTCCTTPKVRCC